MASLLRVLLLETHDQPAWLQALFPVISDCCSRLEYLSIWNAQTFAAAVALLTAAAKQLASSTAVVFFEALAADDRVASEARVRCFNQGARPETRNHFSPHAHSRTLLQRRDMITKHQFAIHLIRLSTVVRAQVLFGLLAATAGSASCSGLALADRFAATLERSFMAPAAAKAIGDGFAAAAGNRLLGALVTQTLRAEPRDSVDRYSEPRRKILKAVPKELRGAPKQPVPQQLLPSKLATAHRSKRPSC